jgi:2-phospho-L-lactate/phosphoenolpyruvate guanylyltransferase
VALNTSIWAIVPAKPFSEAKSRLSPSISADDRRAVARRLLERTVKVLLEVNGLDRILVVSRDSEALQLATDLGANALVEQGDGLNGALTYAAEFATTAGATRILVLHSDLPMLTTEDVDALLLAAKTADVVIAHDRHQIGTNGLLMPPAAFAYAFGQASYSAHLELARLAGFTPAVVARPGLAFDVDYPGDLEELEVAGPETWRNLPA